jgi:hypothetical protein
MHVTCTTGSFEETRVSPHHIKLPTPARSCIRSRRPTPRRLKFPVRQPYPLAALLVVTGQTQRSPLIEEASMPIALSRPRRPGQKTIWSSAGVRIFFDDAPSTLRSLDAFNTPSSTNGDGIGLPCPNFVRYVLLLLSPTTQGRSRLHPLNQTLPLLHRSMMAPS